MENQTASGRVRVVILAVLLALAAAGCRTPQPIVDPPPIAAAGSSGQTRAAILRALIESHYTVESEEAGRIIARYGRSKWNMVVAVDYSNQVAVRYVSSENLEYADKNGTPVIHPGYNKRVQRLARVIGTEISIARAGDELPPVAAPPPPRPQ
ncbi:MAG TPA: hypothetical protein VII72_18505 [Myxococcota bacterium]|jgi:hypothetical protein